MNDLVNKQINRSVSLFQYDYYTSSYKAQSVNATVIAAVTLVLARIRNAKISQKTTKNVVITPRSA